MTNVFAQLHDAVLWYYGLKGAIMVDFKEGLCFLKVCFMLLFKADFKYCP